MFIGSKRIGYLAVGRGLRYGRDVDISFGLWPRRAPAQGDIMWRLSGFITWNWPARIYEYVAPSPDVAGSSAAWTGREARLVGIDWSRWPQIHRGFTFIRD
jgi:hypothetical protein